METKKEKNSLFIYGSIFLVVIIIWLIFIITMFWSANDFKFEIPPSTSLTSLGVFGDSFNILTSLFTGLAFAGVIISVILQTKELEATRQEFSGQKVALQMQKKEMEQQNFDNRFFGLFNSFKTLKNNTYMVKNHNNYSASNSEGGWKKTNFFWSFKSKIRYFLSFKDDYDINQYKEIYIDLTTNDGWFKHYFINLYQLLKYVNKFYENDIESSKFYTNILRAQSTRNELILLLLNCYFIQEKKGDKYKKLVEKFAFFEHLDYDELIEGESSKTIEVYNQILLNYETDAFGNNESILKKIEELR